jgi:formyltetrahydrofolate hydrolase
LDKYNIQDILEEPYMVNLINDINKNGLDYPIVGIEGNHRALALYHLNKDIPYLEMVEIN